MAPIPSGDFDLPRLPEVTTLPQLVSTGGLLCETLPQLNSGVACDLKNVSLDLPRSQPPGLFDPLFHNVSSSKYSDLYQALLTFLSPVTLRAFADFLGASSLAAHTSRKGLSSIMAGLRQLCGGRGLSLVDYQTKFAARETIGCLQDVITSLNRAASRAINVTEGRKLLRMSTRPRAEAYIHAVYLCVEMHKYWFFAMLSGDLSKITPAEMHLLCGYVVTRMLLARPVTRSEALHTIQLSQVIMQLRGGPEPAVTLVLSSHKTFASYGALFIMWDAAYASNELALYIKHLRPLMIALSSEWGRTPQDSLFPSRAGLHASAFLDRMGKLPNMTLSQIRKYFVDYLASLPASSETRDLQACAAHESTMTMKHYSFSTKCERDQKLTELVKTQFIAPATARVQDMAHPLVLPACKCILPSASSPLPQRAEGTQNAKPPKPAKAEGKQNAKPPKPAKADAKTKPAKRKSAQIARLCRNKTLKKRSGARVCVRARAQVRACSF